MEHERRPPHSSLLLLYTVASSLLSFVTLVNANASSVGSEGALGARPQPDQVAFFRQQGLGLRQQGHKAWALGNKAQALGHNVWASRVDSAMPHHRKKLNTIL